MVCEEKLTVKECFDTLLTMSNGKSPGNDGLTKEFYVFFWEDLGSLLVDTLNYAFQYGELSCDNSDREKGPGQETYKELETNLSDKC